MLKKPPYLAANQALMIAGLSTIAGLIATPFAGAMVASALVGGMVQSNIGERKETDAANLDMAISAAIGSHIVADGG